MSPSKAITQFADLRISEELLKMGNKIHIPEMLFGLKWLDCDCSADLSKLISPQWIGLSALYSTQPVVCHWSRASNQSHQSICSRGSDSIQRWHSGGLQWLTDVWLCLIQALKYKQILLNTYMSNHQRWRLPLPVLGQKKKKAVQTPSPQNIFYLLLLSVLGSSAFITIQ